MDFSTPVNLNKMGGAYANSPEVRFNKFFNLKAPVQLLTTYKLFTTKRIKKLTSIFIWYLLSIYIDIQSAYLKLYLGLLYNVSGILNERCSLIVIIVILLLTACSTACLKKCGRHVEVPIETYIDWNYKTRLLFLYLITRWCQISLTISKVGRIYIQMGYFFYVVCTVYFNNAHGWIFLLGDEQSEDRIVLSIRKLHKKYQWK